MTNDRHPKISDDPRLFLLIAVSIGFCAIFIVVSIVAQFRASVRSALPAFNLAVALIFAVANKLIYDRLRDAERQRTEELRKREQLLSETLERAEAGDRTRRAIIANMSHEFRTPLNSVIGFAELLVEGETDGDRAEMARCVQRSGWELLNMVNSLVKAAELSSASNGMEAADHFRLQELAAVIEATFGDPVRRRGLTFETSAEGAHKVAGNLDAIINILDLLIDNAVKYSDSGTVRVNARELEVYEHDRVLIEVTVSDQGRGMDSVCLRRLFTPFEQGEDPMVKRHQGIGVGLYTAKRLAEALRGDIRIESELNSGTTAYLVIPLELYTIEGDPQR